MCKTFSIEKFDLDGRESIMGGIDFPSPEDETAMPVCTCWTADGSPEGEEVYRLLCEALRPFITDSQCGKVVIEIL